MPASIEAWRRENVIISPYYAPNDFWSSPPTILGYTSIENNFCEHYKYGYLASAPCYSKRYSQVVMEECIYGGMFLHGFAHFYIESLNRLYALRKLDSRLPLVFSFAYRNICEVSQLNRDILDFLDVRNPIYFIQEPTLFRNIYMPPPGAALGSFFLPEQLEALGKVESNPIPGRKVYISRSRIKNRGCANEKKLDELLRGRGWEIFYPETLPFAKQVETLASAEIIFCISGSALHSLLFLKNIRQRIITISRVHDRTYNIIAGLKVADYWILNIPKFFTKKVYDPASCIFTVDISLIKELLNKSSDFLQLELIEPYLQKAPHEKSSDFTHPVLFNAKSKSLLEHNLFYRILEALYQKRDSANALKVIVALIRKHIFKPYMQAKVIEFLTESYPHLLEKFNKYINKVGDSHVVAADFINETHKTLTATSIYINATQQSKRQTMNFPPNAAAKRIHRLGVYNDGKSYLEIGVQDGRTFFNVDLPRKIGVDPSFRFDADKFASPPQISFFEMTSNNFFKIIKTVEEPDAVPYFFDIIYIDGLHVWRQALRDFTNSQAHSNGRTLWLFDDTVPSDPVSAHPDCNESYFVRKKLGLGKTMPWHGDVYKAIFFIHDFYPEFSYATIMDCGNPQTVVWKTDKPSNRAKMFGDIEKIENLSWFAMIKHRGLLNPCRDEELESLIMSEFSGLGRGDEFTEFFLKALDK